MLNTFSFMLLTVVILLLVGVESVKDWLLDLTKNQFYKILLHFVGNLLKYLLPLFVLFMVVLVWGRVPVACLSLEDCIKELFVLLQSNFGKAV